MMLSERETEIFLKRFCDHAESRGAFFPHGRPDGRPTKQQREREAELEARRLNNPLSGDKL